MWLVLLAYIMGKIQAQDRAIDGTPEQRVKRLGAINDERQYLEGLLTNRIGFHLLFASVFISGLSSIKAPTIRVIVLITITTISALLCLSIIRTWLLVRQALNELKADFADEPYPRYATRAWLGNANWWLVPVPIMLTILFAIITHYYLVLLYENN
jgi:hypothetical protein